MEIDHLNEEVERLRRGNRNNGDGDRDRDRDRDIDKEQNSSLSEGQRERQIRQGMSNLQKLFDINPSEELIPHYHVLHNKSDVSKQLMTSLIENIALSLGENVLSTRTKKLANKLKYGFVDTMEGLVNLINQKAGQLLIKSLPSGLPDDVMEALLAFVSPGERQQTSSSDLNQTLTQTQTQAQTQTQTQNATQSATYAISRSSMTLDQVPLHGNQHQCLTSIRSQSQPHQLHTSSTGSDAGARQNLLGIHAILNVGNDLNQNRNSSASSIPSHTIPRMSRVTRDGDETRRGSAQASHGETMGSNSMTLSERIRAAGNASANHRTTSSSTSSNGNGMESVDSIHGLGGGPAIGIPQRMRRRRINPTNSHHIHTVTEDNAELPSSERTMAIITEDGDEEGEGEGEEDGGLAGGVVAHAVDEEGPLSDCVQPMIAPTNIHHPSNLLHDNVGSTNANVGLAIVTTTSSSSGGNIFTSTTTSSEAADLMLSNSMIVTQSSNAFHSQDLSYLLESNPIFSSMESQTNHIHSESQSQNHTTSNKRKQSSSEDEDDPSIGNDDDDGEEEEDFDANVPSNGNKRQSKKPKNR
jgi:hypothetical protein